MILEYLGSTINKIQVSSSEITDYITTPSDYTQITIEATKNCGTTFSKVYTVDELGDFDENTYLFYIDEGVLFINPLLLGLTSFVDGVYYISIKFKTIDGYIIIQNCIFIDIIYQCKVAALLNQFIQESREIVEEKPATIIHLLHYSLVNASNCGCNCTEMCTVFDELTKLLLNLDPQILSDCGC